ncbi:hypothetical protein [Leucobacter luti]|uniref:hypothetical protein n=1 Tax=Leucobacter luti TaxID=340320 RepID=UPI001C693AB4|nr:hypothetical protein [Leucobacter luti]QYM76180.1 hypothetical protein K1X41_01430 [Leucobacter luti]
MKMTLEAWGRSVDGQLIDRDGSAGAQCSDLWADYAERAVGVPIGWTYTVNRPGHPDHFLASSMFLFFPTPRVGDLSQYFVQVGRHEPAQAGDVAVWARSWSYPATHIAIATGPAVDGMLPCWTQNPGATRHESLTTAGLLGYLRPIALIEGDEDMTPAERKLLTEVHAALWQITDPKNGLFAKLPGQVLDAKVPMEGSKKGQTKTLRQLIAWNDHQWASIKRPLEWLAKSGPAMSTAITKIAKTLGAK